MRIRTTESPLTFSPGGVEPATEVDHTAPCHLHLQVLHVQQVHCPLGLGHVHLLHPVTKQKYFLAHLIITTNRLYNHVT